MQNYSYSNWLYEWKKLILIRFRSYFVIFQAIAHSIYSTISTVSIWHMWLAQQKNVNWFLKQKKNLKFKEKCNWNKNDFVKNEFKTIIIEQWQWVVIETFYNSETKQKKLIKNEIEKLHVKSRWLKRAREGYAGE